MEFAAILVLGIVALSGAAYAYYWYSPAPVAPHLSTAVQRSTMRVGERERTYLAYVPANLPPKSALVIVLHGSGMGGKRMRECTGYEFDRLADQRGFAVLYPDGYRHNWNDCRMNATFPANRENIDDMRVTLSRLSGAFSGSSRSKGGSGAAAEPFDTGYSGGTVSSLCGRKVRNLRRRKRRTLRRP
jgi:hypothetical protein